MSIDMTPLFRPIQLGTLALPNRIVMAPMTRSFSPNGVPGTDVAHYYRRRAENNVGLIVTEGTLVDHPAAGNDPRVPRFFGADALAGWAQVVKEVHAAGGCIMPQLWHIGSIRRATDQPNAGVGPVSASGLSKPGKRFAEPATGPEIEMLIAAYAKSAGHAHALGFDGIEIHGAHGYLIDQFFWSGTNERTDAFGGDLMRRTQFAAAIVRACRTATAPDFPIVLRFSQWKQQDYGARLAHTPAELTAFLAPLVSAGVDIFHASTRRFWEPEFPDVDGPQGLNLAGWTKKLSGKPVITVGSIGLETDFIETLGRKDAGSTPSNAGPGTSPGSGAAMQHLTRLAAMCDAGEIDLAAVGRALIADPAWASKLRRGQLDAVQPFSRAALAQLA